MLMLASRSPRRLDLLRQLGLDPRLLDVEVPEFRSAGEPALDYVHRVAREKAGAGLLAVASRPGVVVVAADTEVILDGVVFGKPEDADEAAGMLRRLAGRTHRVATVVWAVSSAREASACSVSEVAIAPLDATVIDAYLATGEWCGKAGAYAVQGRAAAFIAHLSGSYSGVMGLPLFETATLLRQHGVAV